MKQEKIDRINELAKKKKTVGLTEEEQREQNELRQEYVGLIRKNFKSTLDTIKIKDQDGNIRSLKQ